MPLDTTPTSTDERTCAAGDRCRDYDFQAKHPALLADPRVPLCADDLMVAERDVKVLTYDYIDLEQMLPPGTVRALDSQSGRAATREPPPPLRTNVEELQRTIWWVTTTWAELLVERHQLADPPYQRRVHPDDPPTRVRDGYAVKWAVGVLTPRVRDLAMVGPVELADYPVLDPEQSIQHGSVTIATLTGVEGVLHLCALHARVRRMLGINRRTTRVPGRCGCNRDGNFLYRDEPRYEQDPCPVYCGACPNQWTAGEYDQYVGLMTIHPELADVEGIDYEPAEP